jgi:EmrB/QacA subfamily drug resistance transporter
MSTRRAVSGEAFITPTQQRWVLMITSLGMFVGMLTSIPLTITVPTIADAFGVEVPTAQWVMTAYFVAQAATMLPIGSAGDILGRSRVFIAGFVILVLGLVLIPVAHSIDTLIFLRGVQGVGSGMIMVTAPAICIAVLPPSQRGRGVAAVMLGGWISSGAGQPVFGLLAQYLPWQSIFLVIVAPAVLGLALSLYLIKVVPQRSRRTFDFAGSALTVVAFGALVIAVGHGQQEHWEAVHTTVHVGPLFLASAAASALYLLYARRARNPIIPLHLFRNLTLTTASITNVLLHMTMLMVSFLMPFYLQNVLGYSPAAMALMFVPMAITLNLMAIPSGWAYDKLGSRLPCTAAMILGAALLLSFMQLTETSSLWQVLLLLVLSGIVLGLFVTPNVSAMLGAVRREDYGLISGFEQTTRNVGHAMGVVLASAVAAYYIPSPGTEANAATYVSIVHGASLVAGVMMGAGAVLALFRHETRGREEGKRDALRPLPSPLRERHISG